MTMTRRRLLDDSFKKTVDGNPAIATDSLARMYPGIEMQGWTEQAKTTGAQLFDASKIPTKTQSGATVTNNGDGSFTISGSGNLSGRYSQQVALDNQDLETFKKSLKQGNITLKCESVTIPYFQININTSDGEEIIFPNYSAAQITKHLDQDQIDKIIEVILVFYGEKESPITNTTIKPMFYQSGDGTWEPYTGGQPSPSPDYPQEIVSAGNWNEETQKWEYKITIANAQTDPDKNQTVTLTADRPLTKWDRLEKRNGQWGWVYKSEEIESYTDESVPGEYFSTTGQLSTGAQVWYETTTETFVPLTASEQEAMNALHTYRPTTVLSNQQDCDMTLTYKSRKGMS